MSTAKRIFAKIYELHFGRLIKTAHHKAHNTNNIHPTHTHRHAHAHTHPHTGNTHNKVKSQQEADADAVAEEYEAAVVDKDTTAHIDQK